MIIIRLKISLQELQLVLSNKARLKMTVCTIIVPNYIIRIRVFANYIKFENKILDS